uniref:Slc18a-3 n=1 Tax=Schmidtea mediterranea TaxID=79327 RepID=A0A0H3YK86_SCHMD|nr:slc18a-3 [Schmidtea mediterranea]
MIFDLQPIDLLIIFSISLAKYSVGFITGMVIPIFPTLIDKHFNESLPVPAANFSSEISVLNSSFNYQQLSILFATKNICQILLSPWMGYFCGRLGSLNILFSGVGLQTVSILFYGFGNKYFLLIIGRIFEALASGAINCAVSSFVAYRYTDHKKLGLVYGIGGLGLCIGGASGPAYGGWVFQYHGKLMVFLTVLSMTTVEAILILSLMIANKSNKSHHIETIKNPLCAEINEIVENKFDNEIIISMPNNISISSEGVNVLLDNSFKEPKFGSLLNENGNENNHLSVEKSKPEHNIFYFLSDPYFMICLGAFPVMYFSLFVYYATLPHFMKVTFGASESQQGVIWLLNLVGYFIGFLLGNFLNAKFAKSRHIVLMVTVYVHAIGALCISLMPSWWSIAIPLCLIVNQHLVFEIIIAPLLTSIVAKRHESKFGLMAGIIMMAIALTSSCGSFLGPILFSKIGFLYLNIIVAVMGLVYGPLLLMLKQFV